MAKELPTGGSHQHWTLGTRPFSRFVAIAASVMMFALAIIYPLESIFGTPCKTRACVAAGNGPVPIWAALAGFLFFGLVGVGSLSVAWLRVASDGNKLVATKLFWRVFVIDLAEIKDVHPSRYGPTYELHDGTRRHSPIPQGDLVGLGQATKARVTSFIALVLADASAARAVQTSSGRSVLVVDAAVVSANQSDASWRSMRALTVQLTLSTALSIVVLVVAASRHGISPVLVVIISVALVFLEIVLLISIVRSRKRKNIEAAGGVRPL